MIKKALAVAMLVVTGFTMAACGADNGNHNETESVSMEQEKNSYVFEVKGVSMEINGDVTDYVAKLKEPSGGTYEAKSCAFEGLDKFWYYDGFTLQGYQNNGNDLLYSITFDDDTVKTKEGIKIGDRWTDAVKAYGDGYKSDKGMYCYESDGMQLQFIVKDDCITNITYVLVIQ